MNLTTALHRVPLVCRVCNKEAPAVVFIETHDMDHHLEMCPACLIEAMSLVPFEVVKLLEQVAASKAPPVFAAIPEADAKAYIKKRIDLISLDELGEIFDAWANRKKTAAPPPIVDSFPNY